MPRRLEPDALYDIKLVEDPQIHPGGERIAFVIAQIDRETYDYHRSIWVVDTRQGTPQLYTSGNNDTTPRWSPDGRSLAFVRSAVGELKPKNKEERDRGVGKPQVFVLATDGGEARQLTWAGNGAGDPTWSPDGETIVYVAEVGDPDDREAADAQLTEKRVPAVRTIDRLWNRLDGQGWNYERRAHLFRVPSSGGTPEQLTHGDWDDGAPALSPDGKRIAFTSDRSPERWTFPGSDIWVLDLGSKALTRITDEHVVAGPPAWSPDGRQLAFTASARRESDGYTDLMVADVTASGSARRLTEDFKPTFEDMAIDDQRAGHGGPHLYWSADGQVIYSQAAGKGGTLVYSTPSRGGEPRPVVEGKWRAYALSMDHTRRRLAFAASDPVTPGDLYVQDVGGQAVRLTQLNDDLFRESDLVRPEEFSYRGADGWDIQAWIMRPGASKEKPPPAILEVHGGPMAMYSWSFFFEFQLLAAHGFAVLYTNPRGSVGYGRRFSDAVRNDWGGKDFDDIMAGVDAAVARGWIDPERLGIAGGSYGGYMTNWAIGHSDRFKAAITMRCVSSLPAMFGYSDLGWFLTVDEMGGSVPWKNLDWLTERSPITYVEQMKTPLLILHSDNDLRCPIGEAEQLFTSLKFLGREVQMIRFEGQSHDLSRSGHPRSRVIRLRHIVGWFLKHIPTDVAGRRQPAKVAAGAAGD
ncbi:MAG TPA: S9 family peptidase [Candidatus Dormibacteraeota bacterium]|nr:S9 family peptidase [Candidatus Dormibacteraeota bacterium]